jgi:Raf kinase inhibitor-like YbhB/YbcL family protein
MIKISSGEFSHGEPIPKKYSCDGEGVNPSLKIDGGPSNCKSLSLIFEDPDAPSDTFTHWVVWNIDPKISEIAENSVPSGGIEGSNSAGKKSYIGPCPPQGTHRYIFKIFALDSTLDLVAGAQRSELEIAMKDHILDQGELMGKYTR